MKDGAQSEVAARRIRSQLFHKGWSLRRLAKECQSDRVNAQWLSESVLRNIFRSEGDARPARQVTVDDVVAIATALEVPAMYLWPIYLDEDLQAIELDFPSPAAAEDFLRSLRVTIAGLVQLAPFMGTVPAEEE